MNQDIKGFIKDVALQSGKIITDYYRKPIIVEEKSDESPVTIADKKTEEYIRQRIMTEFPEHGIIGEEFGSYKPDAEFTWVLDPIDGTKSFICGVPLFGTLIALKHFDSVIYGAFHQPVLGELLAGDGETTTLNDSPVKMRNCDSLSDAVLLATDHLNVEKYQDAGHFNNLIHKARIYRTWGDCYGYYLLATGFADIMIDPIMNLWDACALIPIILGAGGKITDYHGGDPLKGNSIIACAPSLHSEIMSVLHP